MKHVPELPDHLKTLLGDLRELCGRIREHRWNTWRRVDPFIETLFDRAEKGRFLFGTDVAVHDSVIVNGDVIVGEGSHIAQQCTLDGSGGLRIGRGCSMGAGVRVMTHDSAKWALTGGTHAVERSAVNIGDNCFIGANSVITRGVTIGSRCVIGAGAVVTKDIPPHSIALGVPARVVGHVELTEDGVLYHYD